MQSFKALAYCASPLSHLLPLQVLQVRMQRRDTYRTIVAARRWAKATTIQPRRLHREGPDVFASEHGPLVVGTQVPPRLWEDLVTTPIPPGRASMRSVEFDMDQLGFKVRALLIAVASIAFENPTEIFGTKEARAPRGIPGSAGTRHELARHPGMKWFGYGSSWIDDVDGDCWEDLAVSDQNAPSPTDRSRDVGAVLVFSGRDGRLIYALEPNPNECDFGWDVERIVDANDDGTDDFVVFGSSYQQLQGVFERGPAFVRCFCSRSGNMIWECYDVPGWNYVSGMATPTDDTSANPRRIFLWGVPREPSLDSDSLSGLMLLEAGHGGLLWERTVHAPAWYRVVDACFLGDIDCDGVDDLALGVYEQSDDFLVRRSIEVRSGANGDLLRRIMAPPGSSEFGRVFCAVDVLSGPERELFVHGIVASEPIIQVYSAFDGIEVARVNWARAA